MQQCVYNVVQDCLEIQEATDGKVWIILQQNIIDTAVNKWRKRLRACVLKCGNIVINVTAGSWETKKMDEVSAKVSKMWAKCVYVRYLDEAILPLWVKMKYFVGFGFPR